MVKKQLISILLFFGGLAAVSACSDSTTTVKVGTSTTKLAASHIRNSRPTIKLDGERVTCEVSYVEAGLTSLSEAEAELVKNQVTTIFYFYTSRNPQTAKVVVDPRASAVNATYVLLRNSSEERPEIRTDHAYEVDVSGDVFTCKIQYTQNGNSSISSLSNEVVIGELVVPTPTESPTPEPTALPSVSPTPTYSANVTSVTSSGMGGRHIKVTWSTVPSASGYTKYQVFLTASEGGFDFNTPTRVISDITINSTIFGELNDGTTYYAVVRAANDTSNDGNIVKAYGTTLSAVWPNTLNFESLKTALLSYLNYTRDNIQVGGIVTIAGRFDELRFKGGQSTMLLAPIAFYSTPSDVVFDSQGNLYLCDVGAHRVHKIDPQGNLTRIAGTGTASFSGDGGQARDATLNTPVAVAVDPSGNVYISDFGNNRIRKVTPAGIISTVAGDGTTTFVADGGQAALTGLKPYGLTIDSSGNIIFADYANYRVRKVTPAGIISTIAGTGTSGSSGAGGAATSAQLKQPMDVAIDSLGRILIADRTTTKIWRIKTDSTIEVVAGDGNDAAGNDGISATSSSLRDSIGVNVDANDNIYIVEFNGYKIRKVNSAGVITTVAGTGVSGVSGEGVAATSAKLKNPRAVAFDSSGKMYIADAGLVRSVDTSGIITTYTGQWDANGFDGYTGNGQSSALYGPYTVNVDGQGNVYVGDTLNHIIRKISVNGNVTHIAGTGTAGHSGDGGSATSADISTPQGIAVDSSGNVYFSEAIHYIRKISTGGTISTIGGTAGGGTFTGDDGAATSAKLSSPYALAIATDGTVYFADRYNFRVRKINPSGIISTVAGTGTNTSSGDGGAATSAGLKDPTGVALDTAGNLYIAEYGGHKIRKVTPAGIITTVGGTGTAAHSGDGGPATSGGIYGPAGVAVDNDGNLYIAEQLAHRIRKIDANGVITTIGGSDTAGFLGEGGLATSARLNKPNAIAVDPDGRNVYFADYSNNRVRMIRMK